MNTEQDANQIINFILSARRLKKELKPNIDNVSRLFNIYSAMQDDLFDEDPYGEKRSDYEDDFASQLGSGHILDETYFHEDEDEKSHLSSYDAEREDELSGLETVFVEGDERGSEDFVVWTELFIDELNDQLETDQQNLEQLRSLGKASEEVFKDLKKRLSKTSRYSEVVNSDLGAELIETASNISSIVKDYFKGYNEVPKANRKTLEKLIRNGINELSENIFNANSLDERIDILTQAFFQQPTVTERPATPEVMGSPPGGAIKVFPTEEDEVSSDDSDEVVSRRQSPLFDEDAEGWQADMRDTYVAFESSNSSELMSRFGKNVTSYRARSSEVVISKPDNILNSLSINGFSSLIYEDIPNLQDGKSIYDEIKASDFLTFSGSVFSGKFTNVEDALGAKLKPSEDGTGIDVEIDNEKIEKISGIIGEELLSISKFVKNFYEVMLKTERASKAVAKINLYRRLAIKRLDYLIGSIKRRDIAVIEFINEELKDNSDLIKIKENCLISNIYNQNGIFYRKNTEQLNELSGVLINLIKPHLIGSVFLDERIQELKDKPISWQEDIHDKFIAYIKKGMEDKIKLHLSDIDLFYGERNLSEDLFLINIGYAKNNVLSKVSGRTSVKNTRVRCTVCGKTVFKKYRATGEESKTEREQLNDPVINQSYESYSLIRNDGSPITLSDLANNDGAERSFKLDSNSKAYKDLVELSKTFGISESEISEEKTWREIEEYFYSGSSFRNIESIIRKSMALKELGGKYLGTYKVSTSRIRCPFGPTGDRVRKESDKGDAGKGRIFVPEGKMVAGDIPDDLEDFKGEVIETGGSVWDCGFKDDAQQISGLKLYLEDMVGGAITLETKNRLVELSKKQSSGGFKFSNRSFICPTRIAVPEDKREAENTIRKFNMLAVPMSQNVGVFQEANDEVAAHPISRAIKNNEPILSLYCGAKTSLSQFDRVSFADKLKQIVEEENNDLFNGIINSMIELGVDVSDILPYTVLRHSQFSGTNILEDNEAIDSFARRTYRISELLKKAMATATTSQGNSQINLTEFFNLIKDINLICEHDHTFSIDSSLRFASTHIDWVKKSDKSLVDKIVKDNILNKTGMDQVNSIISLNNGFIRRISKNNPKLKMMKLYDGSNFRVGVDKISDFYFEDPNDEESFLYINSEKALSIYPMPEGGLYSAAIKVTERAGNIGRDKYLTSHALVERTDSEGDAKKVVEELAAPGLSQLDELIQREELSDELIQITKQIRKGNHIAIALIKNSIISIQELLTIASAPSQMDVNRNQTDILKKKLKGLLNSEAFRGGLKDLLTQLFKSTKYGLKEDLIKRLETSAQTGAGEIISADEIIEKSSNEVITSLMNDLGENPRVFIYSIGLVFNRYLHRKIVEAVLSSVQGNLKAELSSLFFKRKRFTVQDVEEAIPVFTVFEEMKKVEMEILDLYKDPKITTPIGMEQKDLQKQVTELWLEKQITIASTAFYIADRLSEIYNLYLDKASFKYIGYPLLVEADLSDSDKIIQITLDDLLTLKTNQSYSVPETLDLVGLYSLVEEMLSKLVLVQEGAAYACRSDHYRNQALKYIKDVYNSLIASGETPAGSSILNKVVSGSGSTEILLSPPSSGKYSRHFSEFENAHILIPNFLHPTVSFKSAFNSFIKTIKTSLKPIYLIKNGNTNYHDILGISRSLTDGGEINFAVLIHSVDLEGLDPFLKEKGINLIDIGTDFAEAHSLYYNNGWRLCVSRENNSILKKVFVTTKDLSNKQTFVSIMNHPGTHVSSEEGEVSGYINSDFGINTANGIAIGTYGDRTPMAKIYPPLSNSISNIGIPVPIDISKPDGELVLSISLSDMPIDIPMQSGDTIRVNLYDFLQRETPELARQILFQINSEYERFSKEYSELIGKNKAAAEKRKKAFSKHIKSLFNRYRSLPIHIKKNNDSRTKKDSRELYSVSTGYYIPIVEPTLANIILTRDCFGKDYARSSIFSSEVFDNDDLLSEGIAAVQSFLVNLFGYDKLAEMFNEAGMVNGERITGDELLDPYRMLMPTTDEDTSSARIPVIAEYLSRKKLGIRARIGNGIIESVEKDSSDEKDFDQVFNNIFGSAESPRSAEIAAGQVGVKESKEERAERLSRLSRLSLWRFYTPQFYYINVGKHNDDNPGNVGIPKVIVDTPVFKRQNSRDLDGVRDSSHSDILSDSDLLPLRRRTSKTAGGSYAFASALEKFFEIKFNGLKKFVELYDQDISVSRPNLGGDDDKVAYFDTAELFKKVSSNIICYDFIKKSKKYKTNVFSRIIINDEAAWRLFD